MCRQEMDVPTGYQSLQLTIELGTGCADRRWICGQELRAFSVQMNLEMVCRQ